MAEDPGPAVRPDDRHAPPVGPAVRPTVRPAVSPAESPGSSVRPRRKALALGAVGPVMIVLAVAVLATTVLTLLLVVDPAWTPHPGDVAGSGAAAHADVDADADALADPDVAAGADGGPGAAVVARTLWALAGGWIAGVALLLAVTDLRTHRLPDRLQVAGAGVAVPLLVGAALVDGAPELLLRAVGGALVPAGILYLTALVSPGAVGLGDVKLFLLLGGWLGYLSVAAATAGPVLGIVVGGLVSLVAVVLRRANLRSHVPLGPPLVVGAAGATWLQLTGALL